MSTYNENKDCESMLVDLLRERLEREPTINEVDVILEELEVLPRQRITQEQWYQAQSIVYNWEEYSHHAGSN